MNIKIEFKYAYFIFNISSFAMNLPISDEQCLIINYLKTNNVMVDAVAGSGKTTTNLHIAKHNKSKKILLLTYNAKLRLETKEKCIIHELRNIEVHSYHSFCVKYYDTRAYRDKVIKKIITENTELKTNINFDIIIIDEAQDVKLIFYNLVCKIIKDNKNEIKMCVLGDKSQSIYNYSGSDERYLTYADKCFASINNLEWKRCGLTESFRITNGMALFVNKYLLNYKQIVSNKQGNKPEYVICNIFKTPFEYIQSYLNNGYAPSDIFILSYSLRNPAHPALTLENDIKTKLKNINIYVANSDDESVNKEMLRDKLVFLTFHQAKGLERKIILVFGFDNSYFKYFDKNNDNKFVCPNVLYVAATRAMEHLVLFHSHDHEYLPFINPVKLHEYTNLIIKKELSACNRGTPPPKIESPISLCRHLSSEVIGNCMELLNIRSIRPIGAKIVLPKVINDITTEEVACINGIAIPIYFQYLKTRTLAMLDYLTDNENITLLTQGCYDKNEVNALYTIDEIKQEIENNNLSIEKMLYLATRWWSYNSSILYKIKQLKKYNWIKIEDMDGAVASLDSLGISENAKYEDRINAVYKNTEIVGFIDCIDNDKNIIYEWKCVDEIEDIHYLHLAIYAYMNETKKIKMKDNTDYKYCLYNVLTDELNELIINYKQLKKIVAYIIIKKNAKICSDDEFFKNLKLNKTDIVPVPDPLNYMICDIETDGHDLIIQIAYQIYTHEFKLLKEEDLIINNGNYETDYYNHFTKEFIKRKGLHPSDALNIFKNDLQLCKIIVGHNIEGFDIPKLKTYSYKNKINLIFPLAIDTMLTSKDFVKTTNKLGKRKYPKLNELYEKLFNTKLDDKKQHNAIYDVEITYKCFIELVNKKIITL